jgi:hypothetical protein
MDWRYVVGQPGHAHTLTTGSGGVAVRKRWRRPGRPKRTQKENTTMDKERLEDVVVESEALRSAHRDVVNRVLRHFGGTNVTEAEVRYWLTYDLKTAAPHLFPQPPQAERRDAGRAGKPPRPQPVVLSLAEHQDVMKRPPAERMTRYRELQQAQETQRS